MVNREQLIRLVPAYRLRDMIAAFIDECRLANLRPKTLTFYSSNLECFAWWCEQTGTPEDPTLHTAAMVRQFLTYVQTSPNRWHNPDYHMSARPASDKTLHAYYRTLNRFYRWLSEQEFSEDSPMAKIRASKVRQDQPDPFSDEELARLLKALATMQEEHLGLRARAMAAVLLDVGLRASELADLEVEHVNIVICMSTRERATRDEACGSVPEPEGPFVATR